MKKQTLGLLSAVAAASLLGATSASVAADRTVKIAGFGAKSGVVRSFGINTEAVMQAAVEHINSQGGVKLGDGSMAMLEMSFDDDRTLFLDVLAANGLEPPDTWDEYLEVAKAVHGQGGGEFEEWWQVLTPQVQVLSGKIRIPFCFDPWCPPPPCCGPWCPLPPCCDPRCPSPVRGALSALGTPSVGAIEHLKAIVEHSQHKPDDFGHEGSEGTAIGIGVRHSLPKANAGLYVVLHTPGKADVTTIQGTGW